MFGRQPPRRLLTVVLLPLLAVGVLACGGDDDADAAAGGTSAEAVDLRLGYFPNITHAPALVGVQNGIFEDALGDSADLTAQTFNAGPEATEALLSDAIDITYIGPNPAVNAYAQSDGAAVRVVAGATSGGAFLVVRDGITDAEGLRGTTIASPQLGNTQDVALRSWLADQGLETDTSGGGEVSVVPQENSQSLETFVAGDIDGAWVPEPWATRMIEEGGGTVLVDEADLWPDGRYVTTHVLVRTQFLEENPDVVRSFLEGHVEAVNFLNDNAEEARTATNDGIEALTDRRVDDGVLASAFENLEFTTDPVASSLEEGAADAESLELLDPVENLTGIYDLTLLNEVLAEAGEEEVP